MPILRSRPGARLRENVVGWIDQRAGLTPENTALLEGCRPPRLASGNVHYLDTAVARSVLLRRNIAIDAETAQLAADAIQAAFRANKPSRPRRRARGFPAGCAPLF